ncbi:uncharacterized protein LOC107640790 [Arachis ipaensis]|uniref:uncharacterized protein LOC107640790 n=1 Tax=Arachis ipaensis TaxID=130454 RepID=UPI0007AF9DC5|nr:uncharacterized protein LOC107640790 [Arachis ipaensis]XP_025652699.1 uncharacterized protein LOC112748674 [Arachis hypogaea]
MASQPHMTTNEAIDFLREEFNLVLHPKMVYRAVKEVKERIMGNEKEQYGKLRDYAMEIIKSNPGSTARVDVIPIPQSLLVFDKIYISFEGCKQGFQSGCRPFIHLNGAFLKTYHGGQLLSVVAQDANNQFYGLLPALKEVMLRAHHQNCVMHMWKNFINRFKDMHIRDIVWDSARCTTEPEFKETMEKLKGVNKAAWEYLMRFELATWVKAFFSHGPKVDNLTNNLCEVFNAKVVKYKMKPVLTMCEEIRCYLMRRMTKHIRLLEHHSRKLAPIQEKRLQRLIKPSSRWITEWVGDNERKRFQVSRKQTKVDVDLIKHTCSCNVWQLTGMPCIHGIAAIRKRHDQVDDYVHHWLCMESIHKTYAHCIKPVPSEEFWITTDQLRPAPPPIKRPIGRPKVHNRNKDPAETHIQGDKLKRSFQVTCSKCNEKGHNYKTCKGAPSNPNWKSKKKKAKKTDANTEPLDQSQTHTESLAENSAVQEKSPNAAATTPSAPVQPPFRPPSQLPIMGQPKTPTAASKFRPKQTIRRPQTSANPPSNSPSTPPPDTTQTQSTSASVATSEETLKVTGSEAIGMNFIPTLGSKNQKN